MANDVVVIIVLPIFFARGIPHDVNLPGGQHLKFSQYFGNDHIAPHFTVLFYFICGWFIFGIVPPLGRG
jgi:hypothetical protein